jgi:hypothetical protein
MGEHEVGEGDDVQGGGFGVLEPGQGQGDGEEGAGQSERGEGNLVDG